MAGVLVLHVISNAAVFSCIFWVLTYVSKLLYTNKYYNYKFNFYECGFKSFTTKTIKYNISYIMLILFLLIYDGEFLILIPFTLNVQLTNCIIVISLSLFMIWLLIALIFDYAYNALDWQI